MRTCLSEVAKRRLAVVAGAIWLTVCTCGVAALVRYSRLTGDTGAALCEFPTDLQVQNSDKRFSLLMFVHPHCPCSHASLEELMRIHARAQQDLAIEIVFYHPANKSSAWAMTSLWRTAQAIPDVRISFDSDGRTAGRFGAKTSGHVVLYNSDGRLIFNGGITPSRGHEGGNRGTTSVLEHIRSRDKTREICPVFGCPLQAQAVPTDASICGAVR
ncbi:MAG: hypothetical protein KDB01_14935 [Planctomycetaceae bacterium]|nr:hypothetical protein [Planctomycetaceae bacterium]